MKKLISLLLVGLIASATAFTIPQGVVYMPGSQTIDPALLALPSVDGVTIGGAWFDLEPTEGNYVFNVATTGESLDQQLSDAETAGKFIYLTIETGGPGKTDGGAKPDWLITQITGDAYAGTKFFTWGPVGGLTTIPVFWEPYLVTKHAQLAAAVGAHVAGHPLVKIVYVPYINANTDDFNPGSISSAPDGVGTSPKSRWLAAMGGSGYANFGAAIIATGKATYDAYFTAFPNAAMTTSIGRIDDPDLNPGDITNHGRNVSFDVILYEEGLHPGKCAAQKNNLNGGGVLHYPGTGTQYEDLGAIPVAHAAQMVFRAYNDHACDGDPAHPYMASRMNQGTGSPCVNSTNILRAAVDTGLTYNTVLQQIYEPDIGFLGAGNLDPLHLNEDIITYAHGQLIGGPGRPGGFSFF